MMLYLTCARLGSLAFGLLVTFILAGCGTTMPSYTEFWGNDEVEVQRKITNVTAQAKCELRQAILSIFAANERARRELHIKNDLSFLNNWAAELQLTLNVAEKGEFNPGISVIDPISAARSFTANLNADASSEATRIGIVHESFLIADIRKEGLLGTDCIPPNNTPGFVIESKLDLRTWLVAALDPITTGVAVYPAKKGGVIGPDAISQSIKFEIVSSGGFSPVWKLVRLNANSTPNLIQARRDRIQTILITIGPTSNNPDGTKSLNSAAQAQQRAQEIGIAVANSFFYREGR